jgi:predicted phosphoribosyltransferase
MFKDRQEAGQKLAHFLATKKYIDPLILALPRGGVPVAHEVAKHLNTSLDVVVSRKIGAPMDVEYGIGAISEDEIPFFNPISSRCFDIQSSQIQQIVEDEIQELRRRVSLYRSGRMLPTIKNRNVILIDDGLATGATALAAGQFLRSQNPLSLTLAVPVGPQITNTMLHEHFDEIICLYRPSNFTSVSLWYREFPQVTDEDVMRTLKLYYPTDWISVQVF